MKPDDPGPDPEWRALLKGGKVQRTLPDDVRARVLARSQAFAAGRTARTPVPVRTGVTGSLPVVRRPARPWLGVALILSVAIAGGALGAVIALRHPPSPAPVATEPAPALSPGVPSDVTAAAPAPPAPALTAGPSTSQPRNPRRVASAADLLPAELALLQRARNAYVDRRFSAALGLLAEHARRFPHGRLAEEREALRVRSLARSGRTEEARRAAAAFAARFPRSILLRHPHEGEDAFE